MSAGDFGKWKSQHLNPQAISKESLLAMRIALDLGFEDSKNFRVGCDDFHVDSYKCIEFYNKNSAVLLRLIEEVERYQEFLGKLMTEIDAARGVEDY